MVVGVILINMSGSGGGSNIINMSGSGGRSNIQYEW